MRRSIFAVFAAASFAGAALATSATAGADPASQCDSPTVTVQGEVVNAPSPQVCDNDMVSSDGLLGNLPVVGNLPGLGGIL
jgi:hypothetical protein